jgi:hypothetical protein
MYFRLFRIEANKRIFHAKGIKRGADILFLANIFKKNRILIEA